MRRLEHATHLALGAGRLAPDALRRVDHCRADLETELAAASADGVFSPREVAAIDALMRTTAAATGQLAVVSPGVVP